MDMESNVHTESQSKPTNAVEKATPSWTVFNANISSRIKQVMQRKKRGATTKGGPQQLETIVEGERKTATHSITPEGLLKAIQAAASPSASTSETTSASTSASASASTSASTSGSESSPPSKPESSRKGMSLFERMMPSRKRKVKSTAKVQSRVEYILFDDDGNPAWTCLRARDTLDMGTDSDTEKDTEKD